MSDFFDKYFNIKKIAESKREYKRQMARVDALPKDYRFVFKEIQKHMWQFAGGDGMDMLQIHYDLIDLFESGASEGKRCLEITGTDVAAFCDELLRSAKTYTEDWREKLNKSVREKLGGQTDE
jgi:DNA-binding ferritin-like protein (Dps family)